MSLLEHFDHPDKKQDKEHFRHLIQVASVDGIIDGAERIMLNSLGKNLGFTDPEVDELMASTKGSTYHPPYELFKRFEQLYDIVKMVLADGEIEHKEMRLANMLAIKSGFVESELPALMDLLIIGINKGEDIEDLFKVYKKKIMVV